MAIFQNQATLTYSGGTTNSNIVTGEIVEVLSATKTALRETFTVGDTVTYIVSLINTGSTAFTGLTLIDDLGEYTAGEVTAVPLSFVEGSLRYFIDGVLQATPTVTDASPLTVTGITVPANGNIMLIYEARVTSAAPPTVDGAITNTVTVTGGGLSAPITASETVTTREGAVLGITKALDPETVAENEPLTYTFVISNTGNTAAVATDNIVITDTFDPILGDITVTLDGETLTEGVDYTYDEETGEFATVQSRITVPAATFTQDPETGAWEVTPGVAVLRVTGIV